MTHHKIRIHATSQPCNIAKEPLKWTVAISTSESNSPNILTIKDIATSTRKNEVQWYLEQYAQQDPFAVSRARAAHKSLTQYAKNLFEQLHLDKLISSILAQPLPNTITAPVVEIEVSEDELDHADADKTVHQLYWETLEDTSQWLSNVQFLVRRTLVQSEHNINPVRRVISWHPSEESIPTLNLLLVVARDLSKVQSSYQDVTPSLVSGILGEIGEKISHISKIKRLNVEIVRPGTLEALEKHLERASRDHGSGYFHIVHFDLHGAVRKSKGVKTAYLYFASPTSDHTVLVPAKSVANLLQKHQVPFAVLNSCESARANAGDDANIAKIFQSEGLQAVLAMSFKISSHAAGMFLTSFYNNLLLRGLGFSRAAFEARKSLRDKTTRPSRFGLQREILDWFVPVCYVHHNDIFFVPPLSQASQDFVPPKLVNQPEEVQGHEQGKLFGREFDLLRLERLLVKRAVVYLHGVFSVGKTAILKHACKIWKSTSFFDDIIYLDLADEKFDTPTQIAKRVLNVLIQAEKKNDISQPQTCESDLRMSDDDGTVFERLKEILQRFRILIIFDRLHDSFSNLDPLLVRNSNENVAANLNSFLLNITTSKSGTGSQHSPYFIFAGRKDLKWFIQHIDVLTEIATFELQTLQVSDSLDLAQSLLGVDSLQQSDSIYSDLDQLESVIDLLQNNPGAMCEVLPYLTKANIHPQKRYLYIHGVSHVESFIELMDEDSKLKASFTEIYRNFCAINDDLLAILIVLGLYWHEGPQLTSFCQLIKTSGLFEDVDNFMKPIFAVVERGFLAVGNGDPQIIWIHPLFTLSMRSLAIRFVQHNFLQQSSESIDVSDDSDWASFFPISQKAARLVCSILPELQAMELPSLDEVEIVKFRQGFLDGLETQWWWKFLVAASTDIHLKDMTTFYLRGLSNTLTCINIITTWISEMPIRNWPHTLLVRFSTHVKVVGTSAQKKMCAEHFERLMKLFVSTYGYAVERDQLYTALNLVNYLTWSHLVGRLSDSSSKRSQELHQLSLDILTASEKKYGYSITDGAELYEKGYVIRLEAMLRLVEGKYTQAVEVWKRFMILDELWVQCLENKSAENITEEKSSLLSDFRDPFIEREAKDKKQAEEMRQRLQLNLQFPVEKAYVESRKSTLVIFEAIASSAGSIESQDWQNKVLPAMMAFNPGFKKVADVQKAAGLKGLDSNTSAWPEDSDLVALIFKNDDRAQRLYALENATDSGDWVRAAEHHQSFMKSAMMAADIGDALGHATATMEIYQKDPSFASSLKQIIPLHSLLVGQDSYWKAIIEEPSEVSAEKMTQVGPALDQIMAALKLSDVSPEALEGLDICKQMWSKEAQDGFKWMLPIIQEMGSESESRKYKLQQFFKLVSKRAGDRQYMAQLAGEQAQIMRLFKESSDLERTGEPNDLIKAFKIFDELEDLSTTDVGSILIDVEVVKGDRERYRCKHDTLVAIKMWHQHTEAERYQEALEQLEILDGLKETAKRIKSNATYETLDTLYKETEMEMWNKMFTTASNAKAGSMQRINLWTKLLNLHHKNKFSHLEESKMAKLTKIISLNRTLDRAIYTSKKSSWTDCIKYCDEWLEEAKAMECEEHLVGHDIVDSVKEGAEIAHYNNEYAKADMHFDFEQAVRYVDIVEAVSKRVAQRIEDQQQKTTQLTLLEQQMGLVRWQLNTKIQIMRQLGPIEGRKAIEMQRRLMSYKPPIV